MTFKLGDLVRFVDEAIEGRITSLGPGELVGVTDDTGFEIPVQATKITLVYGQMIRADDTDAPGQPEVSGPFIEEGIFLAVTGDQRRGIAQFYLINGTSYQLPVSIAEIAGSAGKGVFSGLLAPKEALPVYTANFTAIGHWPTWRFQFLFHTDQPHPAKPPLVADRRIRPADFTGAKEQTMLLPEKAWIFQLDLPVPEINTDKLAEHFMSHRPRPKK